MQNMITKITADHLADFRRLSQQRLQAKGGITKFNYALSKVLRASDTHDKKFNTEVMNTKISHATVNKQGDLERNPQGGLIYTTDKQRQMNDAILDLSNSLEFEIKPHFCALEYLPDDLSAEELLVYTGLVIEETDAEFLLEHSAKEQEAILLQKTLELAVPSLSPEGFEHLEMLLAKLAITRNVPQPKINKPAPVQAEAPAE